MIIEAFLEEERLRGRRVRGIKALRTSINRFFEFIEEFGLHYSHLSVRDAQEYQRWLLDGQKKKGGSYDRATVTKYISTAKVFFAFLLRNKWVYHNPFDEVFRSRVEKKLPQRVFREKDMDLLLERLHRFGEEKNLKDAITLYRLHVLAELLYSSGLRISEAANLRLEDVDFFRSLLYVRDGKGGVCRYAFLGDYAKGLLDLYIKEIRPLILRKDQDHDKIFGTGWEAFGKVMNKRLKEVTGKTGITPITCHGFRHALGYHLLRSGCSIRHIQQILGHKKLTSTEVYTKVDKSDLLRILDTHHPRGQEP